jgi:hypothetical protein
MYLSLCVLMVTIAYGTAGSPGYLPSGVADAYAALRLLASEPRIDVDRIAILGFSFDPQPPAP